MTAQPDTTETDLDAENEASRGDTCPSVSEKRSRWVVPAASRSAPSRGASEGRRRRSAESWRVTVTGKAYTGPRPRIRWPMSGQADPSRPSW